MAELKGVVDVHGNGSFQNQTGEVRGAEIRLIRHISVRECKKVRRYTSFQNQTGEVRGAEIRLIRHISVRECSLVMCIPISACAHPHWVCML